MYTYIQPEMHLMGMAWATHHTDHNEMVQWETQKAVLNSINYTLMFHKNVTGPVWTMGIHKTDQMAEAATEININRY